MENVDFRPFYPLWDTLWRIYQFHVEVSVQGIFTLLTAIAVHGEKIGSLYLPEFDTNN